MANWPTLEGVHVFARSRQEYRLTTHITFPDDFDPLPPMQLVSVLAEMSRSIWFINGVLLDYENKVILAPDGKFHCKARIDPKMPPQVWWRFW